MRPAGVSAILVPRRSNSEVLSSCSSWRTWALTAGCVRKHDCAALEKLLRRTISRNVWRWSRSISPLRNDPILAFAADGLCYDERVRKDLGLLRLAAGMICGQHADSVLVVINDSSALSKTIGEYYVRRRAIPLAQVCHLKIVADEEIARAYYDREIAAPIANFLREHGLVESILYMVTTAGGPLRVGGRSATLAAGGMRR